MWASAKSCCRNIDGSGPHGTLTRAFAADLQDAAVNRLTVEPVTLLQYRSVRDFPGGTITLVPLRQGGRGLTRLIAAS